MIFDKTTQFSAAQAITSGSAASTNIVYIGIARNIGVGTQKLYLVIALVEAMVGASATVTATLRTSATASAAAPDGDLNGTVNTLLTDVVFAEASAIGTQHVIPLPPASYLKYIDVYYTLAGGTLSAGKFTAFLTTDVDQQHSYAEGFNPN